MLVFIGRKKNRAQTLTFESDSKTYMQNNYKQLLVKIHLLIMFKHNEINFDG